MRNSLIERGLQRAQLFSWQKTAAQTMDVFINVAEAYRKTRTTKNKKTLADSR
jgi:hypothetical protein